VAAQPCGGEARRENDGLLTPEAVRWGEFKGICRGVGRRGISHNDEIDLRRRPLSKQTGDGLSDVTDLYREIVSGLRKQGF
jgi:triacylglycerol lipase